jgi:hypothetical protein
VPAVEGGGKWQETRQTAVAVMSRYGVPIDAMADAVGHANANITKAAYRHQIGDEIAAAAHAWDAFTASAKAPAEGSS